MTVVRTAGKAMPVPASKTETNVWQDVHAYFKELFNQHQALKELNLTTEQLVSDMEARFKGRYNSEMIAKLLKNGFEVKPGHYVFKRDEFLPLSVKGKEVIS